jgi:hypothetical protein
VSKSLKTKWTNQKASNYVHIAASQFGQPSFFDPSVGGMAIWKGEFLKNTCLDRIEIRDEAVPHCITDCINHVDYVYVYINYTLIPSRFVEASALSKSLGYDAQKQQLWARCGTIEGAVAVLALATQIGNGSINLNYARTNDLLNHYLIASQDGDQAQQLSDLLCFNVKHQLK